MVQRGKTVARIRSSASEREIYMTWGLPTAVTTKDALNMSPQPSHPDLKFVAFRGMPRTDFIPEKLTSKWAPLARFPSAETRFDAR